MNILDKSVGQVGPVIILSNGTKVYELNVFEDHYIDLTSLGSIVLYYPVPVLSDNKGKLVVKGDNSEVITFKGEGWNSDDFIGNITHSTYTPPNDTRTYRFNKRGLVDSTVVK